MKALIGLLLLICLIVSCKKKQTRQQEHELTKWELVPGHYKVYDSTGTYIYEMDIVHTSGINIYGGTNDTLQFINFDGQFDFLVSQNVLGGVKNNVFIGIHEGVSDSINNHWNILDLGSDDNYNSFKNDTIVFHFQKQNMPYWLNDATPYFNANLKHIAVKQH